jgi:hypothetical protein
VLFEIHYTTGFETDIFPCEITSVAIKYFKQGRFTALPLKPGYRAMTATGMQNSTRVPLYLILCFFVEKGCQAFF